MHLSNRGLVPTGNLKPLLILSDHNNPGLDKVSLRVHIKS